MVEVGGGVISNKRSFCCLLPRMQIVGGKLPASVWGRASSSVPEDLEIGIHTKRVFGALISLLSSQSPPALTSASSRFFLSLVDFFWKTLLSFFFLSDPLSLLVGCSSVSCSHFPQFVLKLTLFRLTVAVPHWPWCGYLSGLSLFFPQEKILETAVNVSTVFWYVFFLAYEGPCSCASRGKKWPLLRQFAHLERQLTGTSFSSQREIDPVRLGYHSFNFLYHSLHSLNLF